MYMSVQFRKIAKRREEYNNGSGYLSERHRSCDHLIWSLTARHIIIRDLSSILYEQCSTRTKRDSSFRFWRNRRRRGLTFCPRKMIPCRELLATTCISRPHNILLSLASYRRQTEETDGQQKYEDHEVLSSFIAGRFRCAMRCSIIHQEREESCRWRSPRCCSRRDD